MENIAFFCQNNLKICKYLGEAEAFTSEVTSSFTVSARREMNVKKNSDKSVCKYVAIVSVCFTETDT